MRYRYTLIAIATAGLMGASLTAAAGDAAAGKAKAASCQTCHMPGNATNPNLNGQPEAYLVTATKTYKNGQRNHAVMTALVSGMSDGDIEDVAAYFASLPCQ